MKIVVTGAAGFIGSHLAEALLESGHKVSGIDSFDSYYSPQLKERNAAALASRGIEIARLDLSLPDGSPASPESKALDQALASVDAIYHLAAQPGNSANTSFDSYLKNNVIATYNLLEAAKRASVKHVINISTSSVYGFFAEDDENAAPKPVSHYGVTKLAAEQLVLAQARKSDGIPACSVRLFSVYGERERPDKLYPLLIKAAFTGEEFPLFAGSEQHMRSFTYVRDAVSGLMAVLNNWEAANGEIFNIGSDSCISTGQGIAIVERLVGREIPKRILPARPGDQLSTKANIAKARHLLGYNPSTPPETGLAKMVEWMSSG